MGLTMARAQSEQQQTQTCPEQSVSAGSQTQSSLMESVRSFCSEHQIENPVQSSQMDFKEWLDGYIAK